MRIGSPAADVFSAPGTGRILDRISEVVSIGALGHFLGCRAVSFFKIICRIKMHMALTPLQSRAASLGFGRGARRGQISERAEDI